MEKEVEHPSQETQIKPPFSLTRQTIYLLLLGCLFLPIMIVSLYAVRALGVEILFVALLSAIVGLSGGWYLLRTWEQKMQRTVSQLVKSRMQQFSSAPPPNEVELLREEMEKTRLAYEHQIDLLQSSVAKSKDQVHQLNLEMGKKLEQMRVAYLEFEDLRKEYLRLEEEYAHSREETQKSLKQKEAVIAEYQKTMAEQRMIIEKKQRYIAKLEGKVRDLMYEIRSLLHLEELPAEGGEGAEQSVIDDYLPATTQTTPYDFSVQLQRYVEKAENLTGADHLGYVGGKSPRFLDMSLDSYAIDRRRLFDSFRDETAGILFIYSLFEKKFLFVNQLVKTLMGWSTEKFMKEFPHLVTKGYPEWVEALSKIKGMRESQCRLLILTKEGRQKQFECYMGIVSKGPFSNHVIGLLKPQ